MGAGSVERQTSIRIGLCRMSLIEANREYVNKMLTEVVGMKALLMDDETVRQTLAFSLLSIF